MEKVIEYFTALDGTRDWDEIGPLYDAAFHPDCVFVTADAELNKDEWAQMVQGLVEKGATISGFEVTGEEGDSFSYRFTMTVGDEEPLDTAAKGTLKEGRLVRVEPLDPAVYSAIVERSK